VNIKLAGRTDLSALFKHSCILSGKLSHTPFLVFNETNDDLEVVLVDRASALSAYPRTTKLMVQWKGEHRSDFYQMTVGEVLDAMETNIAGKDADVLRQATEVILRVGPKGGFRSLSYRTPGSSTTTHDKEEGEQLIAFFKKNNIAIEQRVQP
jgi:hypothetical protein